MNRATSIDTPSAVVGEFRALFDISARLLAQTLPYARALNSAAGTGR
jgi:hypothetical protein